MPPQMKADVPDAKENDYHMLIGLTLYKAKQMISFIFYMPLPVTFSVAIKYLSKLSDVFPFIVIQCNNY